MADVIDPAAPMPATPTATPTSPSHLGLVDAAAAAERPSRARWNSPVEFTITCIGYAVGLGNFWRFPYLCYLHGGGAFLVPYTLVLLVIGMPLFCLDLYVGQKCQVAATYAWREFHPALGGIGYAGTLATFIVALYYNTIVAWALWFLGNSFADPLPWADVGNETTGAVDFWEVATLRCRGEAPSCSWAEVTDWTAAAAEAPSLFDTGGLVGPLVGCHVLAWFLIWLCVCKGIESLGRVAWFTAIFPYFVLAILLVRGLTLPGAWLGLRFYLEPRFDRLGDPKVWIAAASQIFYSTGVGWGTLVAFASYNEPDHDFMRDAWLVPLINCGTSFLAGLVVFSVLGFMASEAGVGVEELRLQGSGLAFVAYPSALAQMPGAQIFAVLFFVMVVCLGVDSQFAMVETVLTALNDAKALPSLSKPTTAALVCLVMGMMGLVFVTRAGAHWLDIFDTFAVTITLFICGALECVAVCWLYGDERFAADTLRMTKRRLPKPLLVDLKYVIPSCLLVLTIWTLYSTIAAGYAFPPGGIAIGWLLSLVSNVPIGYHLVRHGGGLGQFASTTSGRLGHVGEFLAACARGLRAAASRRRRRRSRRAAKPPPIRHPPPARLPKEVACVSVGGVSLEGGQLGSGSGSHRDSECTIDTTANASPASK